MPSGDFKVHFPPTLPCKTKHYYQAIVFNNVNLRWDKWSWCSCENCIPAPRLFLWDNFPETNPNDNRNGRSIISPKCAINSLCKHLGCRDIHPEREWRIIQRSSHRSYIVKKPLETWIWKSSCLWLSSLWVLDKSPMTHHSLPYWCFGFRPLQNLQWNGEKCYKSVFSKLVLLLKQSRRIYRSLLSVWKYLQHESVEKWKEDLVWQQPS